MIPRDMPLNSVFRLSKWFSYILFSPSDTEERHFCWLHAPLKYQTPVLSFGNLSLPLFFCVSASCKPCAPSKSRNRGGGEQRKPPDTHRGWAGFSPSRTFALPALCLLPCCTFLPLPGKGFPKGEQFHLIALCSLLVVMERG